MKKSSYSGSPYGKMRDRMKERDILFKMYLRNRKSA